MPKDREPKDAPHTVTDEERAPGQDLFGLGERERRAVLAWVGENLPQVRRSGPALLQVVAHYQRRALR